MYSFLTSTPNHAMGQWKIRPCAPFSASFSFSSSRSLHLPCKIRFHDRAAQTHERHINHQRLIMYRPAEFHRSGLCDWLSDEVTCSSHIVLFFWEVWLNYWLTTYILNVFLSNATPTAHRARQPIMHLFSLPAMMKLHSPQIEHQGAVHIKLINSNYNSTSRHNFQFAFHSWAS